MAAGQGFKTFATGDVLTAADTNGYLMQGVWVFADAAARSAAVTSPQEGNMSYLKDTNSTEYYSGSAWVAVGGSSSSNTFYAGKNKIINGKFDVWQRGTTSGAINTAASYQADRWKFGWAGTGTGTISQQTFTPGAAPVAGYESSFFQRFAVNTVGSSTDFDIYQPIEDVRTFAGQTVTFSFWAKADSARTITVYPFQVFGTGGSAAVALTTSSVSVTTSWARYSATIAVPSISGKTIGTGSSLNFGVRGTFATSLTLDIWGVQLEAGSTATDFQTATGSIQGELALCQRYYYRNTLPTATAVGTSLGRSSTVSDAIAQFPVTMRTNPSAIEFGGTWSLTDPGVAAYTITTFTFVHASLQTGYFRPTTASGLSQGKSYTIDGPTSGYIGFSAEL
jgi:hypothetical protein